MGSSASFLWGTGGEQLLLWEHSGSLPWPVSQLRRAVRGLCPFRLYLPAPEDGGEVPAPWRSCCCKAAGCKLWLQISWRGGEQKQLRGENQGKRAGP